MCPEIKTTKRYTLLVLVILGILVIGIPLGYYLIAYQNLASRLETEAEVSAIQVSQVIAMNPEYWQFTEHRLAQYITNRPKHGLAESRRIMNINNEIVSESIDHLETPLIMRSHELNDSGVVAGRLEITASLRPILIEAGFVFLFVLPLGLVAFATIYYIPIRQIDRAEKAEQESRGKLEMAYTKLQVEVEERKKAEEAREQLITELKAALAEVKQLSSLLPICASCKKIRDDKGYWNQLEVYFRDHSSISFTHGICPDCAKKLYPDINLYDE